LKTVKIGIDLDGVLGQCAEYMIEEIYKRKNVRLDIDKDIWDHALAKCIPEHMDVADQVFAETGIWSNMAAYEDNVEAFRSIRKKYGDAVEFVVITARKNIISNMKELTKQWLDTHRFPYDDVCLVPTGSLKGDFASQHDVEIFVEDRAENVIDLSDYGIATILVKRRWNIAMQVPDTTFIVDNGEKLEVVLDAWLKYRKHMHRVEGSNHG
jgi:uncharacterized HAD superfamily protein